MLVDRVFQAQHEHRPPMRVQVRVPEQGWNMIGRSVNRVYKVVMKIPGGGCTPQAYSHE